MREGRAGGTGDVSVDSLPQPEDEITSASSDWWDSLSS